jgi:restriction endonuclease S subunit
MSFGHPYILKIDGCIHDGWLVLHYEQKTFNLLFLQSFLSLPVIYNLFSSMAAGGVVNNLNSEVVKKLPLFLPPLTLQNQFAAFVEQADKSKFTASRLLKIFLSCILKLSFEKGDLGHV